MGSTPMLAASERATLDMTDLSVPIAATSSSVVACMREVLQRQQAAFRADGVPSASLRIESLNTRLARLAARTIERNGGSVDLATLAEFDAPSYSQDTQDSAGIPDGPAQLRQRLEAAA